MPSTNSRPAGHNGDGAQPGESQPGDAFLGGASSSGADTGRLRLEYRIRLARETWFYGPGAHQLLRLTAETKSLREACRRMGISYSKGRRIISVIEQQQGCAIVESKQGGKHGGSSVLTAQATELMKNYDAFYREAALGLQKLFEQYFPQ